MATNDYFMTFHVIPEQ